MMLVQINLPFNQTTLAAQRSPGKDRRSLAFIALVYAFSDMILSWILNSVFKLDFISAHLIAYIPVSFLTVWFALKKIRMTPSALGMNPRTSLKPYLPGVLLAVLSLVLIWCLLWISGGLSFSWSKDLNRTLLFILLLGFLCQGFMEEFLCRGLLQTQLAIRFGMPFAILVNSLVFGLLHVSNDSASLISVSNTILIGLVFSLMYYYHDNIWFVAGFHSAWNFVLGPILGIAVSVMPMPTSLMVSSLDPDKAFWSGGIYGFEAGFLVTLLSLVLVTVYGVLVAKKYGLLKRSG